MPERPNVLFVLVDQMRASAMGCAGNDQVHTPTLDRLAEEGVLCERAYTPDPVCTPARASILTGQYPHQHGVVNNNVRIPQTGETLACCLREAGYDTGYIGKWHLDGNPKVGYTPPGPRRQGFDYWEGFNRGHEHLRGHPRFTEDGELYWAEGYQPAVQTDLALDFMGEHADAADPFFTMLSWGPPHTPFEAPAEYSAMYDPEELELRENVPESEDTPELREDLAEYYALVTSLDDQMERLLDFLDERGIAEDTLVVFTSDHGEQLGSVGHYRKGFPFEESINVPLLARYPEGLPAGERREGLVNLIDLLPTFLGWAGAEVPDRVQGRDARAFLRGDAPGRDAVYVEGEVPFHDEWRAVRTEDAMLAVDRLLEIRHLYDTEADPYQMENLAGDPAAADLQEELFDRLVDCADAFADTRVWSRWFSRDVIGGDLDHDTTAFDDYDDVAGGPSRYQ
jgi:arylsulfatase A-like enzyme